MRKVGWFLGMLLGMIITCVAAVGFNDTLQGNQYWGHTIVWSFFVLSGFGLYFSALTRFITPSEKREVKDE